MKGLEISREQLLQEAEKVIGEYLENFGDRFRFIGEPGKPKPSTETTDSDIEPRTGSSAVPDTRVHTLGRL